MAELRNLTERLLLFAPGEVVQASDLPEGLGGAGRAVEDLYRDFGTLEEGLRAFARYYVRRILTEEHGSVVRAAKHLGLAPEELEKRLGASG